MQIEQGGPAPEPFYSSIGGKFSQTYAVIEACFIYFQSKEFKEQFKSFPVVEKHIGNEFVEQILATIGIFLKPIDRTCLNNELAYKEYTVDNVQKSESTSIDYVLQCIDQNLTF